MFKRNPFNKYIPTIHRPEEHWQEHLSTIAAIINALFNRCFPYIFTDSSLLTLTYLAIIIRTHQLAFSCNSYILCISGIYHCSK